MIRQIKMTAKYSGYTVSKNVSPKKFEAIWYVTIHSDEQ